MNSDKPYTLYEELFGKLLVRCQPVVPRHKFRFKNLLYSLDASTIDLCLGMFPWADFRKKKGAVELHVGLSTSHTFKSRVAGTAAALDTQDDEHSKMP